MAARRLHPYLLDAAMAIGLVAASVLARSELHFGQGPVHDKLVLSDFGGGAGLHRALVAWWLFSALIGVGLPLRHRWPVAALVLVAAGAAGHLLDPRFGPLPVELAVPVVLYTVASRARTRRLPAAVLAVLAVGGYLVSVRAHAGPPPGPPAVDKAAPALAAQDSATSAAAAAAGASVQWLLVLVLAVALGDAARSRAAHLRAVEQRAAEAEREQEQRAALASAVERARLTRELHDIIAHGLSVMVVQAQGAAAALNRHPERAATALQEVITTGRSALTEMRRLLGLVRADLPGEDRLAPQPGVGALHSLVDQVRATGTPVRLRIDGKPVPLPATVDLFAYRIVQEALTNTLKHAGSGAAATVHLAFAADRLEVEVSDDGAGSAANGGGSAANGTGPRAPARGDTGNGLRGIAERVGLLGGELVVGASDTGGFRVRALLPLEAGR